MEVYDQNVKNILGISPEISSFASVQAIHERMIELKIELFGLGQGEYIPHYRAEQRYKWHLLPGVFRGRRSIYSANDGKKLEQEAVLEFEKDITSKLGSDVFRELFNNKPNGKDWDLLFQAQHGQIHTTLLDWTMNFAPSLFFGVE